MPFDVHMISLDTQPSVRATDQHQQPDCLQRRAKHASPSLTLYFVILLVPWSIGMRVVLHLFQAGIRCIWVFGRWLLGADASNCSRSRKMLIMQICFVRSTTS